MPSFCAFWWKNDTNCEADPLFDFFKLVVNKGDVAEFKGKDFVGEKLFKSFVEFVSFDTSSLSLND